MAMFAASLNTLKKRATQLVQGEDGRGQASTQDEPTLNEELGPGPLSLEARQALREFGQSPHGRRSDISPVLVRYTVQNGDEADRDGAVFFLPPVPGSLEARAGITVGHVRAHFPMPGRYHFRFKAQSQDSFFGDFILADLNDEEPVPEYRNEICIKALKIPAEADGPKVVEQLTGGGRFRDSVPATIGGGRVEQNRGNSPQRSSSPNSRYHSPPASSYESTSRSPPPNPRPSLQHAQTTGSMGMSVGPMPQQQSQVPLAAQRQSPQGGMVGMGGVGAGVPTPKAAGPPGDLMEMDDISFSGAQPMRTPTGNAIAAAAQAAAAAPPSPPVVFDRAKLVAEREALERQRVSDAAARQQEATQREDKLKADKVDKNNELAVEMDRWAKTPDGQAYKDIKVLLSTLHTVTWQASGWKELPLAELVASESKTKTWYRKAILLVHPDKQVDTPPEQQVRADRVFQALNEAFKVASK